MNEIEKLKIEEERKFKEDCELNNNIKDTINLKGGEYVDEIPNDWLVRFNWTFIKDADECKYNSSIPTQYTFYNKCTNTGNAYRKFFIDISKNEEIKMFYYNDYEKSDCSGKPILEYVTLPINVCMLDRDDKAIYRELNEETFNNIISENNAFNNIIRSLITCFLISICFI